MGQILDLPCPTLPLSNVPTRSQKEKEALGGEEVENIDGRWGHPIPRDRFYIHFFLLFLKLFIL